MSLLSILLATALFSSNARSIPFQASLVSLNQTVQGRVFAATPFSRPCYSIYEGQSVPEYPEHCSEVKANYTSAPYRANFYGAFMHDQDETCPSSSDPISSECLLDPLNPQEPPNNASCGQGSVSTYYVEISNAADVQAVFAFARQTGTLLSIKNSGHDYSGRSSLRGSLAIWTRRLQDLEYKPNFNPEGCPGKEHQYDAITIGAGADFDQVYRFADKNNVIFVGGSSPSVGASGGFTMTGGHGLLSSQFGLGIDRVMEFKIVTPDGVFRTANACQNQDLYWALRGGGGNTYGVVLESTSKVEPSVPIILSLIQLPANATKTNRDRFTQLLMDDAIRWAREGWGGPNNPEFMVMVNPFIDAERARKSMATISNYTLSVGGTAVIETHPTFLDLYLKYIGPTANGDVGTATLTTNRLIPNNILNSTSGQAGILTTLGKLSDAGLRAIIFATTPAYYDYVPGSTSATPAWRNSTWMITTQIAWSWNSTVGKKRATVEKLKGITRDLEDLAPESGSYFSESNPWVDDWQQSWWGDNYPELLRLKRKYDPDNMLTCLRCVGWDQQPEKQKRASDCMEGLNS